MGNDGGTTLKRCDIVHESQKPRISKKLSRILEKQQKWRLCHISGSPLTIPFLICKKGFMFNKGPFLEALSSKSLPPTLSHISSTSSVLTAHPTPAPRPNVFMCPLADSPADGNFRFIAFWGCGHICSLSALLAVCPGYPSAQKAVNTCPVCSDAVRRSTVLNGGARRGRDKRDKRDKRKKTAGRADPCPIL
eukprot:gnl/Dysnectes_brevis/1037_a1157_3008.p1 GENE.gnl/Dysnectes_brevis/1037_a1157_3008~~gnl/Dysnectes_brevis/1037_a1157_3008.p1  ORF type:complete len:192 (-),score=17.44 gnl/Dysnectes_brevis/1037_a1157_3008:62-637(-)